MAIQFAEGLRNTLLNAFEEYVGDADIMILIYTGSAPADCSVVVDSGTLLAQVDLPADWMSAASGGEKSLLGTWQETDAIETGTAGYFRLRRQGVGTPFMQGTITATGGGGDLELSTTSIVAGMKVVINVFDLLAGNA